MNTNPEYREKYKFRYIDTAEKIISSWQKNIPLPDFLKDYFRRNKQHGARDRRIISSFVYNYFRLGNGIIKVLSLKDKISIADSLVWEDFEDADFDGLKTKIELNASEFDSSGIFKFTNFLSGEIDKESFNLSYLIQPLLFLRIRPGKEQLVRKELDKNQIQFREIITNCLALPNRVSVDKCIRPNEDAVIQDLNSQRVGEMFGKLPFDKNEEIEILDCCAGSGGKSMLVLDYFKKSRLTVSDKRKSILINLKKRFHEAGLNNYHSLLLDLKTKPGSVAGSPFDLIIADLPCSGSGTWARTPEQMSIFKEEEIENYSALQKTIVENIIPFLKKGGYLLYITCSVFAKENEENINYLSKTFQLELITRQYLKGYQKRADTLFTAILQLR